MPECPNCGQATARTEDWACQWCGYPLLSKSYKRIPKTYKQLKEETLRKPEPVPEPEAEPVPEPEPAPEYEPEPVPEPAPAPAPEAIPEPEAEPVPKPKRKPVSKSKRKPVSKSKRKPAPKSKRTPALKSKPEPVPEPELVPEPEPVPEPTPAAIEVTVEELLSDYQADRVAADARFTNKILKVTGVVDRIEVKDTLDIHYINLTNAEKDLLQNVRCIFDRKHGPELNQLTTGQTVTVQGKYDGSIMDIRMSDCVLVR